MVSFDSGHDKQDLAKHTLPGASLDLNDAFAVGGAVTAAAVRDLPLVKNSPDEPC